MSESRAELSGILETALTYDTADREEVLRFYRETLGLAEVAGWHDGNAFRLGAGVLLLFDRERLAQNDSPVAQHGSRGVGHVCFIAAPGHYEGTRERLVDVGVDVVHDHEWGPGRVSFYFRDPGGNLLEIASADLWPT